MEAREVGVAVRHEDGASVIDIHGEVDRDAEAALEKGYEEATASGARAVVLNFADVDYINSSGIALIVGLLAQARAKGIEVAACGLSDHYREIFEITRLADFMTISDNEQSALTSAGRSGNDG